ncbi:MAG: DUF5069 domain-containing protein [Candidatus Sericytochromatia bacterium]|nr:DUF5069 domain-containing protein [Candidatus Sericytochromatia bacterium]
MNALDLSTTSPRSPYATLGDLPWLARLLDKARAHLAGTMGDYLPYPCGGDRRFLDTFGLDAEALLAQVATGADDRAMVEWVRAEATEDLEEGTRALLRAFALPIPADDAERQEALAKAKADLLTSKPEADLSWVDNFTKLILAEEGHDRTGLALKS